MVRLTPDKAERPAWQLEDTRIRMDIGAYLAATGMQIGDLARQVGITRSTMYARYKHPGELSLDEARRLYRVMDKVLRMAQAG